MSSGLNGGADFTDGNADGNNPYLSHLISDLVEKRKEKRISQAELASMTGILQPGIARLEKAAKRSSSSASRYKAPNLDTLLRVANALGYTLSLVPIDERLARIASGAFCDQKKIS